jgi:uncharacterized protein DUF5994
MSVPGVDTSLAADTPPPRPPRVMLKPQIGPKVSATGYVDGAWWPRSRDLAAQAPRLAQALGPCLGKITGISYNLTAWGPTIRKLRVDGAALRLAGYRFQDADTVDVLGRTHRITLLVVPPQATETAGDQAMVRASAAGNTDNPSQLLTDCGVRAAPAADAPAASGDVVAMAGEEMLGR